MDFKSGILYYGLKCIFQYHFILICFIKLQYVIHVKKKIWISKNNYKNLNQQTIMYFWMIRFGSYFQSFYFNHFLLNWCFFSPSMYVKSCLVGIFFIDCTLLVHYSTHNSHLTLFTVFFHFNVKIWTFWSHLMLWPPFM
jgi:hypothetical protein